MLLSPDLNLIECARALFIRRFGGEIYVVAK